MIARHWTGVCKVATANDYVVHLQQETFKTLESLAGFISASLHKRLTADGVEFVVITHWQSMESIRAFAGEDVDAAVVPEKVKALMVRYDAQVRHYETVS